MRIVTSTLAIACVAMSMPAMAEDKYPASEKEKPGISHPASEKEKPGISQAGDMSPPVAQAMVDGVNIGTAVATDGQIPEKNRTDDFVPGEEIHLTMDVSDAAPGTVVKVVWFGPDDQRIGEQRETVKSGVSTLKFMKDDTKAWKTGDYRAEVWVADEKVNDESFNIVSARSASK